MDRFIDTGQINEFERVLLEMTAIQPLLSGVAPGYYAVDHARRLEASFDRAADVADDEGPARLTFLHVGAPNAPLIIEPDERFSHDVTVPATFDDRSLHEQLGRDEFGRRLRDQIAFENRRTSDVIRAIDAGGRRNVVVVFSDHGSGARYDPVDPFGPDSDLDLRSANLLATRGLSMLDDRATLVDLIPRIAHEVLGSPAGRGRDKLRGTVPAV